MFLDLNNINTFIQKTVIVPLQGRFEMLLLPYIYLALGLTLLLECLIPANPKQKVFSVSFFQDLVWFFYESVLNAFIIVVYIHALTWVYQQYFTFLTIDFIAQWPFWVRFALGVLLLDFLYWLQHFLNHKIPWLWELHAVHHSQKELNFFTDFRYHVVEYVVRHTILVIPFLILSINTPTVVIYSIVTTWYTRFYHGNVRTNLGFLKHVLVTPQSHRVHHSYLPEHRDMNFGSLLCIWDHLFKTQYKGYDEYPLTGIDDNHFPHEKKVGFFDTLVLPIRQMSYTLIKFKDKFMACVKK